MLAQGRRELLGAADLLTSSRFRKRVRARPRCGNSGAHLAAIGEGVKRPWRRSHGANLNPATAVFPAVPVLAKHLHVSVRSTATTAAMEAASRCCACHCDIAARRPQETVRQGRSHGSGNQARDGRRKAGNYGCRRASESRTCGGRSGSRSRWRLGRVLVYSRNRS